jgi:threonine/homoserine/homoserine lactone efflux protein
MILLFLKGLMIGLAISAPVGPIGILCIQRSLHDGFKIGLMTGMGAALADGTYGLIAGFGLTAISTLLITHQFWIRLIGSLFLLYLGVKLFLNHPKDRSTGSFSNFPWHALGTTYLLTLSNPITILSFIAVFAGVGLETTNPSFIDAVILVLGITLSSAIWWFILSSGVAYILHHRLSPTLMRWINYFQHCYSMFWCCCIIDVIGKYE